MTPRATYRLQFHKGFTFDDAAAIVPYLAALGVSHLYASPYLMAHPGSTHGYDIVDHDKLNPELGGEAGFARLSQVLDANGLRQILDFVPNHMGVGGQDNAVWLDLLEWGQEADHAGWFDVDWSPDRTDLRDKVLVPLLGDHFGVVLDAGGMALKFDAQDGSFAIWAHETHKLPVCPLDYGLILGQGQSALEILGDSFADLMRWRPQIMRRTRTLKDSLAALAATDPAAARAIAEAVTAYNDPNEDGRERLQALAERQNWKATHFLVASDDINYRRFFNIATLAGLRMELPDVFDKTHALVFGLIGRGQIDGLRIDHIDGLFDPLGYLRRLRTEAPRLASGHLPYLVVEKILGRDEPLRREWPIDGTTGYEFTNLLTGLFVDGASEAAFTRLYRSFTGETRAFERIVLDGKLQVIDDEMSSELQRLARAATRVARQNARTADFTLTVLQRAMRRIVACFPIYRTYIESEDAPTAEDLVQLDIAIAAATTAERSVDPSVFAFLKRLLSGELLAPPRIGYRRADVFRCAMKFQQYCGPVMAKGVEDTAFYRYNRLVALNEVGGAPDRFGVSLAEFHAANRQRAEFWPTTMLATSTHDTKRGEDTRARLVALSTMPDDWAALVARWSDLLRQPGAAGPDRNDEYLFYQLVIGTWPPELLGADTSDPAVLDAYATRLKDVMTKSIREAKVHSTWVAPDEAYEAATLDLVERAITGAQAVSFLEAGRDLLETLARKGAHNAFAQTVLKLTVPGMPDIYQGAELWDLSMVDPDNRRPVDFEARRSAMANIAVQLADDPASAFKGLMQDWKSGRFKLALIMVLLDLRKREAGLFAGGDYRDLTIEGGDAVCGFVRQREGAALLVLADLGRGSEGSSDMTAMIPEDLLGRAGRNVLTGAKVSLSARLSVADVLDGLNAAVLELDRPS